MWSRVFSDEKNASKKIGYSSKNIKKLHLLSTVANNSTMLVVGGVSRADLKGILFASVQFSCRQQYNPKIRVVPITLF